MSTGQDHDARAVRDPRPGTPRVPLGRLVRRDDPHPRERRHHHHPRPGRRPGRAARPAADDCATPACRWSRSPSSTRSAAPVPDPHADPRRNRHDHHRAHPRSDTTGDRPDAQDLPGRRHPLPAHVRVDPHARAVPARCGSDADFVLGAGSDTGVLWGAFSEVVVALAGIGTAVVLFPVAKRQSETAALGFVAARVLEARPHHRRRRQRAVARHPAARRRRHRRRGPGVAGHHRPHPGRDLRLGVPALAEPACRSSTRCAWAT